MVRYMVIAVIMAAGSGSRVGAEIPKQYLEIGGIIMLRRAADAFLRCSQVDCIIVLCPFEWLAKTRDIFADTPSVKILSGGNTRTHTLDIAVEYWRENFGGVEDILLTHDSARPFVSERIICDNITAARKYGVCGTFLTCADSLVHSENGFITQAISRDGVYLAQTPQSFRAAELAETLNSLTKAQKNTLTDACGAFSMLGKPVAIVEGESINFKITTQNDVELARIIAKNM